MYYWDTKRWFLVIAWVFLIFLTVPFARKIQEFVYENLWPGFFTLLVLLTVISASLSLVYYLVFNLRAREVSRYLWLLITSGLVIYVTVNLRAHPEEAVHFLEYGFLGLLIFRALSVRIRDRGIYITSILIVSLVGILDEAFQWALPERYWDYRDVGINTLGGVLVIIAIWKGIRPGIISGSATRYSLHIMLRTLLSVLIVITLCLFNTPDKVYLYTTHIKPLSWLLNEEPMTVYGYKIEDPEIGIIYSTFSPDELKRIDIEKGEVFGKSLRNRIRDIRDIEELQEIYTIYTNPFVNEFLVHLKRREAYLKEIRESDERLGERSYSALKEDRILERYFPTILRSAGLVLSEDTRDMLEQNMIPKKDPYVSTYVARLITAFKKETILSLLIITILSLLIIDIMI